MKICVSRNTKTRGEHRQTMWGRSSNGMLWYACDSPFNDGIRISTPQLAELPRGAAFWVPYASGKLRNPHTAMAYSGCWPLGSEFTKFTWVTMWYGEVRTSTTIGRIEYVVFSGFVPVTEGRPAANRSLAADDRYVSERAFAKYLPIAADHFCRSVAALQQTQRTPADVRVTTSGSAQPVERAFL